MSSILKTKKGDIAVIDDIDMQIMNTSDFLDIMANAGARILSFKKEHFHADFYDLKTGIAGEILQKVSNYGIRMMIVGDFDNIEKKSLRDFIYESNRTGQIVFASDIESGIDLLR